MFTTLAVVVVSTICLYLLLYCYDLNRSNKALSSKVSELYSIVNKDTINRNTIEQKKVYYLNKGNLFQRNVFLSLYNSKKPVRCGICGRWASLADIDLSDVGVVICSRCSKSGK